MSIIDLHMHSIYSTDGEFTPEELVRRCRDKNLKVVSLTDHNSIKGVPEMIALGQKQGIHVLSGIELDVTFNQVNLHLLGYGIAEDERYHEYENIIAEQELKASAFKIDMIHELGIPFSKEKVLELSRGGIVTGEMIGEAAILEENKDHPLLKPYFPGGDRSDNPYVNFHWDFFAQGKPAYVPIAYMSLSQGISLILDTGGIPVFAHPGQNIGLNQALLEEIIQEGIHGIEAYSSYHNDETTAFYVRKAKEHNLLITAGSDFHGKTKPAISLGAPVPPGEDEKILENISTFFS